MASVYADLLISLDGYAKGARSPGFFGFGGRAFAGLPDVGLELVDQSLLDGRIVALDYRPSDAPPYAD